MVESNVVGIRQWYEGAARRAIAGVGLASIAALGWGCEDRARLGAEASGVVIGTDDRVELAELAPLEQRTLYQSTIAIAPPHRLLLDGSDELRINAPTLQQAHGLCEGERFLDQPTAASCSGVLIDDDLVLSAGHCLDTGTGSATDACRKMRIVFGYSYLQAHELRLSAQDLFFCRRVAARAADADDFLVLQLDRPVHEPWAPAPLTRALPAEGATLMVASHGAGLPLKVEARAPVTAISNSYLSAETDTFAGSSGGPLYDSELNVVAIVRSGSIDWESDGNCTLAARLEHGVEQHQLVARAWDALCENGWPSPRLCGNEPRCGDGVCSANETSQSCADDCEPAQCGDGLCELEERDACESDCHAYDAVPATVSEPDRYLARHADAGAPAAKGGCSVVSAGAQSPISAAWSAAALLAVSRLRRRRQRVDDVDSSAQSR